MQDVCEYYENNNVNQVITSKGKNIIGTKRNLLIAEAYVDIVRFENKNN